MNITEDSNKLLNPSAVQSVGNAWIVCRSKSHPGHNYYFNTFTGKTAWNLSETEIEKAKTTTKYLESRPGANFDKCPEPTHPPAEKINITPKYTKQSRIYNKQIINNKFPSNPSIITPQYSLDLNNINTLGTMPWVGTPSTCNSNVWAIPPNHQIFIAPSVSSSHIQTHMDTHNCQPIVVQNTSLPITKRFEIINSTSRFKHDTPVREKHFTPRKWNKKYQGSSQGINKKIIGLPKTDLRFKLSRNKISQNSTTINQVYDSTNVVRTPNNEKRDNEFIENADQTSQSDQTMINRQTKYNYVGPQVRLLDLTPLKNLAQDASLDCWYIVVDTNVLCGHINFLKNILDSDETCQLVVPRHVLVYIEQLSTEATSPNIQARRVLRLLTQLIDSGSALIANEGSTDSKDDESTKTFNCCRTLAKDNSHVVLIADDMGMLKYKYTTKIPIFTIREVQSLLNDCFFERVNPTVSPMKITVCNDSSQNVKNDEINNDATIIKSVQCDLTNHNLCESLEKIVSSDILTNSKNKMDASVQTNLVTTIDVSVSDLYIAENNNNVSKQITCSIETQTDIALVENTSQTNVSGKKKDIRLKRSISNLNDKNCSDNNEVKHYKWRKKRHISQNEQNPTLTNNIHENDDNIASSKENHIMKTNQTEENVEQNVTNNQKVYTETDDNESCQSIQRNTTCGVMVVEETSTSGVISNTDSNIDLESVLSIQNRCKEVGRNKCTMFEVTSQNMADYLQMRRDEWVSRFVQIMEEVLTQVLQHDPPFYHKKWPPPWSLREATRCITMKFYENSDVVDAANSFSDVLLNISDNRGGINFNLTPSQYMEMYSYGVYLVDALMDLLDDHEDLHIATELLKKLLNDIQNPNLDCCHNDSFLENNREQEAAISASTDKEKPVHEDNVRPVKSQQEETFIDGSTNLVPQQCNLGSNKKTLQEVEPTKEDKPQQNVKFIRNIDIEFSFFKNLKFQRNAKNIFNDIKSPKEHPDAIVVIPNSPNPEQTDVNYELELDSEQDYDHLAEEYCSDREYYDTKSNMELGEAIDNEISIAEYTEEESDHNKQNNSYEVYESTKFHDNKLTHDKSKNNMNPSVIDLKEYFKLYIGVFLREIKETFLEVQELCVEFHSKFTDPSFENKREMCEKAQKAHMLMLQLRNSLDSVLTREIYSTEKNVVTLFKEAMNIQTDDDSEKLEKVREEYKDIVKKCKHQADALLNFVNLFVSTKVSTSSQA